MAAPVAAAAVADVPAAAAGPAEAVMAGAALAAAPAVTADPPELPVRPQLRRAQRLLSCTHLGITSQYVDDLCAACSQSTSALKGPHEQQLHKQVQDLLST